MPNCIHCYRPVSARFPGIRYRVSGAIAHVVCISFPSAAQMDALLVARHQADATAAVRRARVASAPLPAVDASPYASAA